MAGKGGDAPRRGRVDRALVRHVHQHELDTAERLADLGEDVTFIPSGRTPRPDAYLSDGRPYEFKSPTGRNPKTTLDRIQRAARRGKENFVLDLARSALTLKRARDLAEYAVDTYHGVRQIRIIGRQTPTGPLDLTIRKDEGDVER